MPPASRMRCRWLRLICVTTPRCIARSVYSRRVLRHASHSSIEQLRERTDDFMMQRNQASKPFKWTFAGFELQTGEHLRFKRHANARCSAVQDFSGPASGMAGDRGDDLTSVVGVDSLGRKDTTTAPVSSSSGRRSRGAGRKEARDPRARVRAAFT